MPPEPGSDPGAAAAAPVVEPPSGVTASLLEGPFDSANAENADHATPRLDLGSLLVPGLPGLEVQVAGDQTTGEIRAVTVVAGRAGAVQLQAFAAPRSGGLWLEWIEDMEVELNTTAGGSVHREDGPFGPELRGTLPARTADGRQISQQVRFAGIDGPRWMLRATFLGRPAIEPDPDDDLHLVIRQTIVVRGPDAKAPRDPLPLTMPAPEDAAAAEMEEAAADAPGEAPSLDPFRRGPEMTEVR